jgi:hypothetical protein
VNKSKGIFFLINSWADKKWQELDKKQTKGSFKASTHIKKPKWEKFFSQIQVLKLNHEEKE